MIIKSATFVKSAVKPDHYPPADHPEVAFAGRSNVGKSSLINSLVNRRHLVKTSATPGRTQLINFFSVNDALYLVDLPGYGYARVPVEVQRSWGPMIEAYLGGRETLKAVVLIMDIRRLPRSEELDLFALLGRRSIAAVPVLTKADKLPRMRQQAQHRNITQLLHTGSRPPILFSAKTGQGRAELWEAIETCVRDGHIPGSEPRSPL